MIRLATEHDISKVEKACRQFYNATDLHQLGMDYDQDSLVAHLFSMMENGQGYIVVSDNEGEINGVAAAILFAPYFNHDHIAAQEMFWWVHPENRNGTGRELMNALEEEAKNRGAQTMTMMALDSSDGERVGKLYKRRGYEKTETHYMRVL